MELEDLYKMDDNITFKKDYPEFRKFYDNCMNLEKKPSLVKILYKWVF